MFQKCGQFPYDFFFDILGDLGSQVVANTLSLSVYMNMSYRLGGVAHRIVHIASLIFFLSLVSYRKSAQRRALQCASPAPASFLRSVSEGFAKCCSEVCLDNRLYFVGRYHIYIYIYICTK